MKTPIFLSLNLLRFCGEWVRSGRKHGHLCLIAWLSAILRCSRCLAGSRRERTAHGSLFPYLCPPFMPEDEAWHCMGYEPGAGALGIFAGRPLHAYSSGGWNNRQLLQRVSPSILHAIERIPMMNDSGPARDAVAVLHEMRHCWTTMHVTAYRPG